MKYINIKVYKEGDRDIPLPSYETDGAACCDVRVTEIEKKIDRVICHTGLYCEIPEGYRMDVIPRSSLAKTDYYIVDTPGVIDSDYRGEILIVFKKKRSNIFDDFPYEVGDRCAQLGITEVIRISWRRVLTKNRLSSTQRGEGNYGSTGKK